jgi:hypothetical protein
VTELEQSKSNSYGLATAYVELGEKDKALLRWKTFTIPTATLSDTSRSIRN